MLGRAEKKEIINKIRENIDNSSGVFLTNLIGITSNDAVKIRKEVRDADGTIIVARNTLFRVASEGTSCEELFKDLKGANAVAFAKSNPPGVAKIIFEAGKGSEIISFGRGLLEGQMLDESQMKELAQLPSRDQMLATVLATFNAPVSAFVRVVEAIRAKKEEGGGAEEVAKVEEAPAAE